MKLKMVVGVWQIGVANVPVVEQEVLSHMQPAGTSFNLFTHIGDLGYVLLGDVFFDNLINFLPSFGCLFGDNTAGDISLFLDHHSRFLSLLWNNHTGFRSFLAHVCRYFFYIYTCFFQDFIFCKFDIFRDYFGCVLEIFFGNLNVLFIPLRPSCE